MEPLQPVEHIQEKNLAQIVLNQSTLRASESVDAFSNWLLAGFGGAVALLIGNLPSIPLLEGCLRGLVLCFMASAVAAVAAKYLGVVARSGASGGLEAFRLAASWPDADELDVSIVLEEIERASPWPFRSLVKRSFSKATAGDPATGARTMYRMAVAQSWLVLIQTAGFLAALVVLYRGLAA